MKKAKNIWKNYNFGMWIAGYLIFYMLGFVILENAGYRHYHIIHTALDDMIPFCEFFIIPYFAWFFYIAAAIMWFIWGSKDRCEYYQLTASLTIGMTIFLIVSCLYPNKQDLRPEFFTRDNIFVSMVQRLYATDTPTNILPSIHVFNSIAVFFALNKSKQLQKYRIIRFMAGVLTVSIVLATMFLKQHSVVDVSLGILSAVGVQAVVEAIFRTEKKGVLEKA